MVVVVLYVRRLCSRATSTALAELEHYRAMGVFFNRALLLLLGVRRDVGAF